MENNFYADRRRREAPRPAAAARPAVTAPAENVVRGVIGPVGSNSNWSGYSALTKIPSAGLIPVTSTTTVFYLGFTAGLRADIKNMVIYTTARASSTITAVTPVTLGGVGDQTRVGVDGALPTFENSGAAPFFVSYLANE